MCTAAARIGWESERGTHPSTHVALCRKITTPIQQWIHAVSSSVALRIAFVSSRPMRDS